jgi:hypothetical protein
VISPLRGAGIEGRPVSLLDGGGGGVLKFKSHEDGSILSFCLMCTTTRPFSPYSSPASSPTPAVDSSPALSAEDNLSSGRFTCCQCFGWAIPLFNSFDPPRYLSGRILTFGNTFPFFTFTPCDSRTLSVIRSGIALALIRQLHQSNPMISAIHSGRPPICAVSALPWSVTFRDW